MQNPSYRKTQTLYVQQYRRKFKKKLLEVAHLIPDYLTKMSDKDIRKLPYVVGYSYVVCDTLIVGLHVRVSQNKFYYFKRERNGKKVQEKIGDVRQTTLADARRIAASKNVQYETAKDKLLRAPLAPETERAWAAGMLERASVFTFIKGMPVIRVFMRLHARSTHAKSSSSIAKRNIVLKRLSHALGFQGKYIHKEHLDLRPGQDEVPLFFHVCGVDNIKRVLSSVAPYTTPETFQRYQQTLSSLRRLYHARTY